MEQHDTTAVTDGRDEGRVDEEILSEVLTLLGDGNADRLIHACDLFLTGVPARLADAEAALAEGRPGDVARVAHSLRGTAGTFGARRLSQLADHLEQACRRPGTESAGPLIEEMRDELAIFGTILTTRLASLT